MRATTPEYLSFSHPHPTLSWIVETVRLWHRRAEERAALRRLSAEELHDFGVTPAEAQWEASQPFWRETRHVSDHRGVLQ